MSLFNVIFSQTIYSSFHWSYTVPCRDSGSSGHGEGWSGQDSYLWSLGQGAIGHFEEPSLGVQPQRLRQITGGGKRWDTNGTDGTLLGNANGDWILSFGLKLHAWHFSCLRKGVISNFSKATHWHKLGCGWSFSTLNGPKWMQINPTPSCYLFMFKALISTYYPHIHPDSGQALSVGARIWSTSPWPWLRPERMGPRRSSTGCKPSTSASMKWRWVGQGHGGTGTRNRRLCFLEVWHWLGVYGGCDLWER